MAFWHGEQYRFALFEHNDGTGSACWFEVILFQQKCEKRMQELMAGGTTVILVSHSIEQIERMCSKVAWLSHGHLKMNGDTETVCAAYKATQRGEA